MNRAEFSADVKQFICVELALSCLRRAAMQLDELPLRGAGDQAHEDLVAITDEQVHGGARTDAAAAIIFCALCEVRCALLSNFTYVGIIFLPYANSAAHRGFVLSTHHFQWCRLSPRS